MKRGITFNKVITIVKEVLELLPVDKWNKLEKLWFIKSQPNISTKLRLNTRIAKQSTSTKGESLTNVAVVYSSNSISLNSLANSTDSVVAW